MERRWGPTEIKGLFGRWPSTMSTFFDKVRKVSTLTTSSTVRMGACDGHHACVCSFLRGLKCQPEGFVITLRSSKDACSRRFLEEICK